MDTGTYHMDPLSDMTMMWKGNGKVHVDTETYYRTPASHMTMIWKGNENEMEKYIWIQRLIIWIQFRI